MIKSKNEIQIGNLSGEHENFKILKKQLGLKNKDIAIMIGTTEQNIKVQTRPSAPLAKWAVSMLFVWHAMNGDNPTEATQAPAAKSENPTMNSEPRQ